MHSDWTSPAGMCLTWVNRCAGGCNMCSPIGQASCSLYREPKMGLIQTPLIQRREMAPHYKSEWCYQKRGKVCQAGRHNWCLCRVHGYHTILKGAYDPQNDHLGFLLFFNLKVLTPPGKSAHCLFFQGPFTGPGVIFRVVQALPLYA